MTAKSIRLAPIDWDKIENLANLEHLTLNAYLRRIILKHIDSLAALDHKEPAGNERT